MERLFERGFIDNPNPLTALSDPSDRTWLGDVTIEAWVSQLVLTCQQHFQECIRYQPRQVDNQAEMGSGNLKEERGTRARKRSA